MAIPLFMDGSVMEIIFQIKLSPLLSMLLIGVTGVGLYLRHRAWNTKRCRRKLLGLKEKTSTDSQE
ncbi:hypothetical protein [Thermithiobacillus plumbiphilus]|uniref:Uncharacterized protein n=1 Tax=Thermithiobacillus plumbiphilus TaxID=1729899 RepID=A0ABU9DA37_9PROT